MGNIVISLSHDPNKLNQHLPLVHSNTKSTTKSPSWVKKKKDHFSLYILNQTHLSLTHSFKHMMNVIETSSSVVAGSNFVTSIDQAYRPLPWVYLVFFIIWSLSSFSWTINTWRNSHLQTSNLQWAFASVPVIKALQLGLSFLFWYSCFNLQICSLWMSFGVYVTGVLFQTASLVLFLLISHGYGIICERLSLAERRATTALGCIFYLTVIGYRACVPYFTGLLVLNYVILFYVIFHHISRNLLLLRGQLNLIEEEDIHTMHDAIYSKYTMIKKFQNVMQIVAVTEILIYFNMDDTSDNYWLRLLVREWAQSCIFLYLGWTFRLQLSSPHFSVMPSVKCKGERTVPPIYSIEMDAEDFKGISSYDWHIAVPTSAELKSSTEPFLVIVQHPRANSASSESPTCESCNHCSYDKDIYDKSNSDH